MTLRHNAMKESIFYHQKVNETYIIHNDMEYVKEDIVNLIWRVIIQPAQSWAPQAKILDFCCRTGYYIEALACRDCEVVGIEALPDYVKSGLARGRRIIQGDATYCDKYFPEEHFDGVIALHAIEHLEAPYLALTNLRKVVKPESRCLLISPREGKGEHVSFTRTTSYKRPYKHRCVLPSITAIKEIVPDKCWEIEEISKSWRVLLKAI